MALPTQIFFNFTREHKTNLSFELYIKFTRKCAESMELQSCNNIKKNLKKLKFLFFLRCGPLLKWNHPCALESRYKYTTQGMSLERVQVQVHYTRHMHWSVYRYKYTTQGMCTGVRIGTSTLLKACALECV